MRNQKIGRDNLTRKDRMGKLHAKRVTRECGGESLTSIIITGALFLLAVVAMGAFVIALSVHQPV